MVFLKLYKSRLRENGISYTAVEEQWEGSSAWKVDQLVSPLLGIRPMNALVHLLESSSLSIPIQNYLHPSSPISLRIHM